MSEFICISGFLFTCIIVYIEPNTSALFLHDSTCISYKYFCLSWVPVYVDKEQRLGVMSIGFLLDSKDDAVVWRGPKKNGITTALIAYIEHIAHDHNTVVPAVQDHSFIQKDVILNSSFSKNLKSSSDLKHGKDNGYQGD